MSGASLNEIHKDVSRTIYHSSPQFNIADTKVTHNPYFNIFIYKKFYRPKLLSPKRLVSINEYEMATISSGTPQPSLLDSGSLLMSSNQLRKAKSTLVNQTGKSVKTYPLQGFLIEKKV